jgi:hypothetical protein
MACVLAARFRLEKCKDAKIATFLSHPPRAARAADITD